MSTGVSTVAAHALGSSSGADAAERGVRIVAAGLATRHRNGTIALDDIDLVVEPGRLTAVIGPSGAGKTTLLEALAGVSPTAEGHVTIVGADDHGVGYVPQDDILHGELPLRRTLKYAAMLRMTASAAEIDAAVEDALTVLSLQDRADVAVQSLSGGQRKRANIACEILTRPKVCFLDEPTSGLDPAAAADLVDCMRDMAAQGSTVVFTTHSVADVERSDHVVVLAPGGRVAASGTPADVLSRLGAETFVALYESLTGDRVGEGTGAIGTVDPVRRPRRSWSTRPQRRAFGVNAPGAWRQWRTLTRRSADVLTRNRLTVAILLGSPAAVIAMFAILFRPEAPGSRAADLSTVVQVSYWLAFAGFFFGLTFGLLQVCTEVPILRRERFAGMRIGPYVASKLTLLVPVLLVVDGAMVAVLWSLDRLPDLSVTAYVQLNVTMALDAAAALCLGLLASAAVTSTAQAALALPMLCFPAVLFSGAIVPTPSMTGTGDAIAAVMSDRWAFESIARQFDAARIAPPSSAYTGLGASQTGTYWMLLVAFAVAFAAVAYVAVRRRAARGVR